MEHPLLGLWSLLSWNKIFADSRQEPYSSEAIAGFLYYGPDAKMSVTIYEVEQLRLLSAYAGHYEYCNHEVVHYPILGSSPYGIEGSKIRRLSFEKDCMSMETHWTAQSSKDFIYRLIWQKKS